jgi:hypothetical protein
MLEVQQASIQMAGHSKLEQIRASMRGDQLPAGGAAAINPAQTQTNPAQPQMNKGQAAQQ